MPRLELYLAAFAVVAIGAPHIASACSRVPPREFTLSAGDADDVTPPAAPTVTASVERVEGKGGHADSAACETAEDRGYVILHVSTTDDRAPAKDIGYHVRFIDGSVPHDLTIIDGPILAESAILLPFEGEHNGDFDFRISVSAVDRNGNYSEPTTVSVGEDHLLSCSSQRVDSHAAVWLALAFVLWPRRRRR